MFTIISKRDYWGYLDAGVTRPLRSKVELARNAALLLAGRYEKLSQPQTSRLKDIQDAFVLSALDGAKRLKILELGGGRSRVLPVLSRGNECWNVDKFEGEGGGPVRVSRPRNVRIVRDYMGNFNGEIPDDYFDYVISISAVEHIPGANFADAMRDCHRVLKPGGIMLHAIDVYLFDALDQHTHAAANAARIKLYLSTPEFVRGLSWLVEPEVDETLVARASFAANHCDELYAWNRSVPRLKEVREIAQSCSLRMGMRKLA